MVSTHGYVAKSPPLGAADTGGQVVYVLELSKKLAELGYEVDIWTRRFEDQPDLDVIDDRTRVIRVPCGGDAFIPKEHLYEHVPEWTKGALKIIRANDLSYELIDSHYWDAGLAGMALAEQLSVPHAHTPHSLGSWKRRQMQSDRPNDEAALEAEFNFASRIQNERTVYEASDVVIATTPPQIDHLFEDYGLEKTKCRMIPPGYDDRRFFPVSGSTRQSIRRRLGLRGHVIMAIGRLATNKGYDLLIRAFRLVAERDPDALLVLAVGGSNMDAGEAQLLQQLKDLVAAEGLEARVRFESFIPDDDLPDHYRAADEFVLSSRYEPFGMTAIEAMACGTPTVITVHGGLYRAVTFGRHALFADTFDREDLGMTMLKPFRLPRLRARLAKMGAHKARSLFSWTGIAHQLLGAIGRHPPPEFVFEEAEMEWDEPWNDGD